MKTGKSVRRRVMEALDRPGGRWILSEIATRRAKRLTGKDVSTFYDGIWMHRVGDRYLADSPKFKVYDADILAWEDGLDKCEREAADYWFQRYKPSPGDVIVDVGAGIGTDAIAFSKAVGPGGKVYAIEAHPTTFLALAKVCSWNRLGNVQCIQAACMDRARTVHIEDTMEHEGNAITDCGEIEVPAEKLDSIIPARPINFLKMNIEGAERFALRGMEQTIRRTRYVAIACHDFRTRRGESEFFATLDFTCTFLRDRGFDCEVRRSDPRPYVQDHVHAVNTRL